MWRRTTGAGRSVLIGMSSHGLRTVGSGSFPSLMMTFSEHVPQTVDALPLSSCVPYVIVSLSSARPSHSISTTFFVVLNTMELSTSIFLSAARRSKLAR
jgi:hypothetical protein